MEERFATAAVGLGRYGLKPSARLAVDGPFPTGQGPTPAPLELRLWLFDRGLRLLFGDLVLEATFVVVLEGTGAIGMVDCFAVVRFDVFEVDGGTGAFPGDSLIGIPRMKSAICFLEIRSSLHMAHRCAMVWW